MDASDPDHPIHYQAYCWRLRCWRAELGVTLESAAYALGVSARTLTRYERGDTRVPGKVRRRAENIHSEKDLAAATALWRSLR